MLNFSSSVCRRLLRFGMYNNSSDDNSARASPIIRLQDCMQIDWIDLTTLRLKLNINSNNQLNLIENRDHVDKQHALRKNVISSHFPVNFGWVPHYIPLEVLPYFLRINKCFNSLSMQCLKVPSHLHALYSSSGNQQEGKSLRCVHRSFVRFLSHPFALFFITRISCCILRTNNIEHRRR